MVLGAIFDGANPFWQVIGFGSLLFTALWTPYTMFYHFYLYYKRRTVRFFAARMPWTTMLFAVYLFFLIIHRVLFALMTFEYIEQSWFIDVFLTYTVFYATLPLAIYKYVSFITWKEKDTVKACPLFCGNSKH